MKIAIVVLLFSILSMNTVSLAEDQVVDNSKIITAVEKTRELMDRLNSGMQRDSFSEQLYQLKIVYKKALEGHDENYEVSLFETIKNLRISLDEYSKLWSIQKDEGFKYIDYGYGRGKYLISDLKSEQISLVYKSLSRIDNAMKDGW